MHMKISRYFLVPVLALSAGLGYSQQTATRVVSWVTTPDKKMMLQQQNDSVFFQYGLRPTNAPIVIDDAQSFQTMDGFGYAITGGSAQLLMAMSAAERSKLLKELFSTNGD